MLHPCAWGMTIFLLLRGCAHGVRPIYEGASCCISKRPPLPRAKRRNRRQELASVPTWGLSSTAPGRLVHHLFCGAYADADSEAIFSGQNLWPSSDKSARDTHDINCAVSAPGPKQRHTVQVRAMSARFDKLSRDRVKAPCHRDALCRRCDMPSHLLLCSCACWH